MNKRHFPAVVNPGLYLIEQPWLKRLKEQKSKQPTGTVKVNEPTGTTENKTPDANHEVWIECKECGNVWDARFYDWICPCCKKNYYEKD